MAFNSLPIEVFSSNPLSHLACHELCSHAHKFNTLTFMKLNQHIATYLTNDSDLCNFTLVCHQTHAAVHSPRSSVWRQRFSQVFDILPWKQSHELKAQYQNRRQVLRKGAHFVLGRESEERGCLEVMRDLIIGTYPRFRAMILGVKTNTSKAIAGYCSTGSSHANSLLP